MTDQTERLIEAATAAIRDIGPAIEQAGPKLHTLTVEIELDTRGTVNGAVAWLQHRVSLSKLLGAPAGRA